MTISIAKRKGVNAIDLTRRISAKLDTVRGVLVPADLEVTVTRNYGETAAHKSNELLWHMFLAVVSVGILIWLTLGRREAAVVLVAIPVTLALTLFVFYLYGYTLNRITLFALIFSIGILVDDAIVVVENIVRHARLATGESSERSRADREGRRRGRQPDDPGDPHRHRRHPADGVRRRPDGAVHAADPGRRDRGHALLAHRRVHRHAVGVEAAPDEAGAPRPRAARTGSRVLYRRWMSRLIADADAARALPRRRWRVLLLAAVALVPLKLVTVKMLPFDNKSEFQVIINMPEGTPLEDTARVTGDAGARRRSSRPSVTSVQSYVGTASPYNFNGLVRHYFLRRAPHQADLQVNLLAEGRAAASRATPSPSGCARRSRRSPRRPARGSRWPRSRRDRRCCRRWWPRSTAPIPQRQLEVARTGARTSSASTDGVVDVDWYVEAPQPKVSARRRPAEGRGGRRAAGGASPRVVRMAGAGEIAGHPARRPGPRATCRSCCACRAADRGSLDAIRERARSWAPRPSPSASSPRSSAESMEPPSVYHKNLQPVTYVLGDVAGAFESPVYAILADEPGAGDGRSCPRGTRFEVFNAAQPFDSTKYAMKWDGEWHITYEVFRDLGLAFAAVLLLIYILVVGWFQSFMTPLIIMAAIPFSLVGILPAHAAMGAFFTATSMIGFIAGAGIVVRNSIILVDFIELRVREGMPLEEAVIDAGAVRFRPDGADRRRRRRRRRRHPVRPDLPGAGDLADGRRGGLAAAVASHGARALLHLGETPGAEGPGGRSQTPRRRQRNVAPCGSIRPRSILVAVDFGDASARALRVAAALAAQHGSAMTALHAETLDVPPYFTHEQLKDGRAASCGRSAARPSATSQHFVRQFAPLAAVSLVDGPAVEAVLAAAAHHDLLVLGTHGRRGPSRWWMGSVAERIVRDSPVPALVVRAEPAPTSGEQVFARPVAVAGPEFHGEALSYAHAIAAEFRRHAGREVRVVARRPEMRSGRHAHGCRHRGATTASGWFGETAERLVRTCALPMLFVPNRG